MFSAERERLAGSRIRLIGYNLGYGSILAMQRRRRERPLLANDIRKLDFEGGGWKSTRELGNLLELEETVAGDNRTFLGDRRAVQAQAQTGELACGGHSRSCAGAPSPDFSLGPELPFEVLL